MFPPSSKKLLRIGQWNGRRRSSRCDDAVLPQVWQRSVLFRLGAVLLTALAAALLAYVWGPTQSFRVGQVSTHDLRARVYFEVVDHVETEHRRDEAIEAMPADERVCPERIDLVRRGVLPAVDRYPPGTLLVQRGQSISPQQYHLLRAETATFLAGQSRGDHVRRGVALALVFSLLASVAVLYVVRFQKALAESLAKIVGVCTLVVLTLVLGMILSQACWQGILIPLTATAMILTIAYNPQFALLMTLSLTLAMVVSLGGQLGDLLVAMGGQATAILLLRNVRTRTRLVEVGAMAGVASLAMTIAAELYGEQGWSMIAFDAGLALLWGTLAGFLVSGLLPLVEKCFTIVTDVSLLELGDGSHPLLQELVRRPRAPTPTA